MKHTFFKCGFAVASLCASFSLSYGKTCDVQIEGTDQMQYSTKEIKIGSDCSDVKLTLKHAGKLPKAAMGHNWVLTTTQDKDKVMNAGMGAGAAKDYKPDSPAVIAQTKLIGGGESDTITFSTSKLKKGETYAYFCTFPGHGSLMNGSLIFDKKK